jgi:hypothetical protein
VPAGDVVGSLPVLEREPSSLEACCGSADCCVQRGNVHADLSTGDRASALALRHVASCPVPDSNSRRLMCRASLHPWKGRTCRPGAGTPGNHRDQAELRLLTRSPRLFLFLRLLLWRTHPERRNCDHSLEYRQIATKARILGRSFADGPPTPQNHSGAPSFGKQNILCGRPMTLFFGFPVSASVSGCCPGEAIRDFTLGQLVKTLTANASAEMPVTVAKWRCN